MFIFGRLIANADRQNCPVMSKLLKTYCQRVETELLVKQEGFLSLLPEAGLSCKTF